MAIFHCHVKIHKRTDGRMAVAAAAYRSGSRLIDGHHGLVHDYSGKSVAHSEIMAPANAPSWVLDRERLWNAVEASENRADAQLLREVELALPVELSDRQQLDALRRFISEEFVSKGMVADFNIHRDNPDNPHAHVCLTMRSIGPAGFGPKVRAWNEHALVRVWRESWDVVLNRSLQRSGSSASVDHRSHEARGIDVSPGVKIGVSSGQVKSADKGRERNGWREKAARARSHLRHVAERLDKHEKVLRHNGRLILRKPESALKDITLHQSTFTRAEAGEWLFSRVDEKSFQACLAAVMASPQLVDLNFGKNDKALFSSVEMLRTEKGMLALTDALDARGARGLVTQSVVERACARASLSEEQARAVQYLVRETGDVALLEGWAGTGKSRLLATARELWEKQARRVIGCALSGKASESLGHSAGLKDCRSIAWLEWAWKEGRHRLQAGDVLVVDEAGLVGTRQMARLLEKVKQVNAKLVLVGDTQQLQAVEAGCPFKAMATMVGKVEIAGIRRQKEAWQREASVALAQGLTDIALEAYSSRGFVHESPTTADAVAQVMRDWAKFEKEHPDQTQVTICYRKVDVAETNQALHDLRVATGKVRLCCTVKTELGDRKVGVGDRVRFTKGQRRLGVVNGTLGTVEQIDSFRVKVRLDEKRSIEFSHREFGFLDWGYAMGVFPSQGITVQQTRVIASKAFDRHATYVAATRHTDRLDIYYGLDELGSLGRMVKILSRERYKHLALDYQRAEKQAVDLGAALGKKATSLKTPPLPEQAAGSTPVAPHPAAAGIKPVTLDAAASRLRKLEELAALKPLRLKETLRGLAELAPVREEIRQLAARREYWVVQLAASEQNPSLARRLGLSKPPSVRDPATGELRDPAEGLAKAATALREAAARFQKLEMDPILVCKAQALVAERTRIVAAAHKALPAAKVAYSQAKEHQSQQRVPDVTPVISQQKSNDGPGLER